MHQVSIKRYTKWSCSHILLVPRHVLGIGDDSCVEAGRRPDELARYLCYLSGVVVQEATPNLSVQKIRWKVKRSEITFEYQIFKNQCP